MRIKEIQTEKKEDFINITAEVQEEIRSSGVKNGICVVYVPHTTAGVTINENADPSVKEDILTTLKKMVPDSLPFKHLEGNSPAHVKASLIGPSVTVIIQDGRPSLGTWQGIFFCEFDGPRRRRYYLFIQ